jgi:hypothetical protein
VLVLLDSLGRIVSERPFSLAPGASFYTLEGYWVGPTLETRETRHRCGDVLTKEDVTTSIFSVASSGFAPRLLTTIKSGTIMSHRCQSKTLPLSATGIYAVGDSQLYTTAADSHLIDVRHVRDGRKARSIRTLASARKVTNEMIDELKRPTRPRGSAVAREPGSVSALDKAMSFPEALPAIAAMLVDATGNLWVKRYHVPSDSLHDWWIYDSSGVMLATITLLNSFRPTEIGESYVLGVWRDSDHVNTIRRFRILK